MSLIVCMNIISKVAQGNFYRLNSTKTWKIVLLYRICISDTQCSEKAGDTGPCRGYFEQYTYNSTVNKCQLFVYGGCKGSKNRFKTQSDCQNACMQMT